MSGLTHKIVNSVAAGSEFLYTTVFLAHGIMPSIQYIFTE